MTGDLKQVSGKIVQEAIHSNMNLATPMVHVQQSLAMAGAMHISGRGGGPSVKDQLFPSSRKRRRAKEAMKRKETK